MNSSNVSDKKSRKVELTMNSSNVSEKKSRTCIITVFVNPLQSGVAYLDKQTLGCNGLTHSSVFVLIYYF